MEEKIQKSSLAWSKWATFCYERGCTCSPRSPRECPNYYWCKRYGFRFKKIVKELVKQKGAPKDDRLDQTVSDSARF